jgi:hypothetical protein
MSDFGLISGPRSFERYVDLDLLKVGDKLTAGNEGYHVTAGKVYEVVDVAGKLHVTTDDSNCTYSHTSHVKYKRHALGPWPHFSDHDAKEGE